jgi:hypothetical protein
MKKVLAMIGEKQLNLVLNQQRITTAIANNIEKL